MPEVDLIVFDCDGVLVDSELVGCRVEAEELTRAGFRVTAGELLERFTGITSREMYEILAAEQGRALPRDFERTVLERTRAAFERELLPVRGIHEALARIEVPVCVASSSEVARIECSLRATGLFERFAPHVFSAAMVARGKPAPDLFLHASACMGVAPAACMVVEDSVPGVRAGVAAGMQVLGFTGGDHCGETQASHLREAGADLVFADMTLLPDLLDGAGRKA